MLLPQSDGLVDKDDGVIVSEALLETAEQRALAYPNVALCQTRARPVIVSLVRWDTVGASVWCRAPGRGAPMLTQSGASFWVTQRTGDSAKVGESS